MNKPIESAKLEALLKQREASVQFGRLALQAKDLNEILTKACQLTAHALGTDLAKIMEYDARDRSMLVVAGVGWEDGSVGQERVPALAQSSEGYALSTGKPAISEDIQKEDRFDYAGFLKRHGVEAMVDSREPRDFSGRDIEFLQGYANLIGAAVERHRHQKQLGEALDVQKRLYTELEHRVKNNIATITSLPQLKATRAAHTIVKQEIAEVLQQIKVLMEVYNQLHASTNVDELDLGGYLGGLANNIMAFSDKNGLPMRVESRHDTVVVTSDLAVTFGLVLNEFITNSIKHFPKGRDLVLTTEVEQQEETLLIRLADNGEGLGDALHNKESRSTGSGLGLIEGLLNQTDCHWDWVSGDGTALEIRLPLDRRKLSLGE